MGEFAVGDFVAFSDFIAAPLATKVRNRKLDLYILAKHSARGASSCEVPFSGATELYYGVTLMD